MTAFSCSSSDSEGRKEGLRTTQSLDTWSTSGLVRISIMSSAQQANCQMPEQSYFVPNVINFNCTECMRWSPGSVPGGGEPQQRVQGRGRHRLLHRLGPGQPRRARGARRQRHVRPRHLTCTIQPIRGEYCRVSRPIRAHLAPRPGPLVRTRHGPAVLRTGS